MIFKRKSLKKAGIGDIAVIDHNVLSVMQQSLDYMNNSAPNNAEINSEFITNNELKGYNTHRKIFAADIKLLYISKPSIFGGGLMEVVPLSVNRDCRRGDGIKSLISKKVKYLIHKDSLALVGNADIVSRTDHMGDRALNYIKNQLLNLYDINNFTWANK